MSLSCESRFEFPEAKTERSPGPLEKLWQSNSCGTMFLSGDEVHRREQQARMLGMQETERRLEAEHAGELLQLRAGIAGTIADFTMQRQSYFRNIEKDVVRLSVAIARKIIGKELQVEPAILSGVVSQVLQRLERDSDVTLHVPPSEERIWLEVLARKSLQACAVVVADPSLPPGRCILETPIGSMDLDPWTELDGMEQQLLQSVPAGQVSEEPPRVQ